MAEKTKQRNLRKPTPLNSFAGLQAVAGDLMPSNGSELVEPFSPHGIEKVSHLGLLRRVLPPESAHRIVIFLDEQDFRDVSHYGIKLGVTWDELIRCLIDRELTSNEPFAGLADYTPVDPDSAALTSNFIPAA